MKKFILAILFAQLAVIGAIIWRWEEVVRKGIEFRVPCRAYDPKDPWRGRYLRSSVRADVTVVTNHVIVTPRDKFEVLPLPTGFVMVDKHSVTSAPPLLVCKDDEPTLNPPFWFRTKSVCAREGKWQIDLPNTLYIPERIADSADRILSQSVSQGVTNRAVAVFRAWKGDVVITGIEIDSIPIEELAAP